MSRWYLFLLLLAIIIFPNAEAMPKVTDIGVTLSKTCIILLQNNFTTNCPTYEELILLYGDGTNQHISGKFVYDEHGFLYRDHTTFKDHYNYYTYEGFVLWIDPPGDIVGRIPTITIESSMPEYLIPTVSDKIINNTQILGQYVWLDDKCHKATISADHWLEYFSSVYTFMYNDCPIKDRPDTTKTIIRNATYQDITTSYKYYLDKWVAESKIKCKGLCFEY